MEVRLPSINAWNVLTCFQEMDDEQLKVYCNAMQTMAETVSSQLEAKPNQKLDDGQAFIIKSRDEAYRIYMNKFHKHP